MSKKLFPPLYVKGAGHNDLQNYEIIYEKILEFLEFIDKSEEKIQFQKQLKN